MSRQTDLGAGGQFIIFGLGAEDYAVPVRSILEILPRPEVTRVPLTRDWLVGVFNLRGEILSAVDLRGFIGSQAPPAGPGCMVLVVSTPLYRVGVLVDRVDDFLLISPEEILPASHPEVERGRSRLVHMRGGRLISLLDVEEVLTSEQVQEYM